MYVDGLIQAAAGILSASYILGTIYRVVVFLGLFVEMCIHDTRSVVNLHLTIGVRRLRISEAKSDMIQVGRKQ